MAKGATKYFKTQRKGWWSYIKCRRKSEEKRRELKKGTERLNFHRKLNIPINKIIQNTLDTKCYRK